MFVAISGTPGTGKTAVAKIVAEKTGARLLRTNFLLKKYKIPTTTDRKRKTKIIDTKKLAKAAKKEAYGNVIFESHLAHLIAADLTIVLRTNPSELEKRLKRRGWNEKKIRENVEAEAIGVISSEAKGLEIDTTRKSPEAVAMLIIKLLNSYSLQKRYVKKIDWSESYRRLLRK